MRACWPSWWDFLFRTLLTPVCRVYPSHPRAPLHAQLVRQSKKSEKEAAVNKKKVEAVGDVLNCVRALLAKSPLPPHLSRLGFAVQAIKAGNVEGAKIYAGVRADRLFRGRVCSSHSTI